MADYRCDDGSTRDELNLYNQISWILEGCIHIGISVIGVTANLIAIPILISNELGSIFNRTLAVMAVFDIIFNLCDTLESIRMYHEKAVSAIHTYLFPQLLYPLQNISMVASIYTTVVVAMERYMAVSRPISAYFDEGEGNKWRKVMLYIAPVMALSITCNIPTFFEFHATSNPTCPPVFEEENVTKALNSSSNLAGSGRPSLCVNKIRVNNLYVLIYINIARNTLTGVIPLISLIVLNHLVHKHLVRRRTTLTSMAALAHSNQLKAEKRQAHTLYGVVALFFFGHTFRILLNIHEFMAEQLFKNDDKVENPESNAGCESLMPFWLLISKTVERVLLATSFSGNLVIYCTTSAVFRKVLFMRLKRFFCLARHSPNFGSLSTRTHSISISMSKMRNSSVSAVKPN